MFSIGEDIAAGMKQKTAEMGPMPNSWGVYFAVDDCEGCASKIAELGGKVLKGPFETGVGQMAVAQDPQGAVFSLIQMNEPGT